MATQRRPQRNANPQPRSWSGGLWGAFINFVGFDEKQEDSPIFRGPNKYAEVLREDMANWVVLEKNYVASGVVLSLWDNISGPRVEQAWYSPHLPKSLIQQSAPFTLNGEMMQSDKPDENKLRRVEHKFLLLSHHFSSSLIFCATMNGQLSKFSLSFIFPKQFLKKYFSMHTVVKDRMTQLVDVYKAISSTGSSPDLALTAFSAALPRVLKNLNGLATTNFSLIPFGDQLLARPTDTLQSVAPGLKAYLGHVLTAHFQTGCTLVVGPNPNIVLEWVNIIGLFLLPRQQNLAQAVIGRGPEEFIPDCILQGLVTDPQQRVRDEEIIRSMVPTTVVDLHNFTVKQTHPYNEYSVIRKDHIKGQIARLPNRTQKESAGNIWEAKGDLYRKEWRTAPIVLDIIDKLFLLPASPSYLREGYLSQSMAKLVRRAVVLIKYVCALKKEFQPRTDNEGNVTALEPEATGHTPPIKARPHNHHQHHHPHGEDGEPPTHMLQARIRYDLDITEACFFVLLGIAERLEPGIYISVAGNPAWLEERLIELFEQF